MSQEFVPAGSVRPAPAFQCHIIVAEGQILFRAGRFVLGELPLPAAQVAGSHYLGELGGRPCGVHRLAEPLAVAGCEWRGLRSLLGAEDELHFALAGRAMQVASWDRDHRFCGRCGAATRDHPRDRARVCPQCELVVYPRISPCVIMLVTRGEHCLLARHAHHRHGLYTALAGFIEPGESAEQALAREVQEEVSVVVGGCRYIGSQPWPFPGQLMLGYLAEWAGGEPAPDRDEIAEADWYHWRQLPELLPPPQTLSGQLIQTFVDENNNRQ
ncbi:NAD(+) diphosphatase [Microbulbifer sp. SAOS-129_SWC]|uniref:NAD(+) diphosphatase n=1 Tax=Microbulbifer sp. SAOS-129_SWC TaxID=3145235 RepID=UPI003217522E